MHPPRFGGAFPLLEKIMEIVEYPKQLYRSGWDDLSDTVVVNSTEEEEAARADGFKHLAEPDKATRKAKAEPAKAE